VFNFHPSYMAPVSAAVISHSTLGKKYGICYKGIAE
jgi:hypothetical protein